MSGLATKREGLAGPFPFSQGAFYALSSRLTQWMVDAKPTERMLADLTAGRVTFANSEEDMLVGGYLPSLFPNGTRLIDWGVTTAHSFDDGDGAEVYMRIERGCFAAHAQSTNASQLMTGSVSRWGTPEYVGPHSAVVHRVNTHAAWSRAWALSAFWTHKLRRLNHPNCFYSQEVKAPDGKPLE